MYFDLLNSIVLPDYQKIGNFCEKKLYRDFYSSIQWMAPQIKNFELINFEFFDKNNNNMIEIEIIDIF